MDELFTWGHLITLGGASIATCLTTHLIKDIFNQIPTQILSYLVALVVLVLATLFTSGFNLPALVICIFNAVVVAGTASNTVSFVERQK